MLKKSKFFTFLIAALFLGSFTFISCDNAKSDENTEDTEKVEADDATEAESDGIENTEKCGEGKCGEGKCGDGKEVLPTRKEAEEAAKADQEEPKEVKATRKEAEEAATSKCGDGKELQEKTTEEMTKGAKKIEGRVGK